MANMVVRTNVFALNAHRNLTNVGKSQRQSSQRLSSGFRVNSAADDAAGLAISESMRAQIRGLDQASINAQDGVGLIQTAEGAMSTISDMVIRIRELMVQAANDTNTLANREMIQTEIDQLMHEINDVTFRVQFNTRTLLDGGLRGGGGGDPHPVSLQWLLFDQHRHIGIARPDGQLQPNNRNHNSFRQEIINLQDEYNDLIERIARRQIADGSMGLNDFDFEFRNLVSANPVMANSTATNEGNINILQANGLLHSEVQQLRNITNRLDNAIQSAVRTAIEIFQITNDQINALGGQSAITSAGSNVFSGLPMDDWFSNNHLWWEQICRDLANGDSDFFSWYQGGMNPDGTTNPLRNSAFSEHYPGDKTGARETLFHILQFTGSGAGAYNGESQFDLIIRNTLNVRANVTPDEMADDSGEIAYPEMAFMSRAFRLLVGFEMDGVRVAAHTNHRIPYAKETSLIAFETAWQAEAAARRALDAVNHANAMNTAVENLYPFLSTLTTLRDVGAISPPFSTSGSPLVDVRNAVSVLATLNSLISSASPADPRMWTQATQAITNAIARGNTFSAADALFFLHTGNIANLGTYIFNPQNAISPTLQNAITAIGGVSTGSAGVGLNAPPFSTGAGAIDAVAPIPSYSGSPPTPTPPPAPTYADPPGTSASSSITGLPSVPATPPVNYDPARQSATRLVNGHTLYNNNRGNLTTMYDFPTPADPNSAAFNAAVEDARQAAQNLRGMPTPPTHTALNNAITNAIGAGNNGGSYAALRAAQAAYIAREQELQDAMNALADAEAALAADPDNPALQAEVAAAAAAVGAASTALDAARAAFNLAVANFQGDSSAVRSSANTAVANLYGNFQSAAGSANTATANAFRDIMTSFQAATNNIVSAVTNARDNANITAYNAAREAFNLADYALTAAIHAANNAVEANEWESLAAIIVPNTGGVDHWTDIPPGELPAAFYNIVNPPEPPLTREDIHADAPVVAAWIAARDALAAFAPRPGTTPLPAIQFAGYSHQILPGAIPAHRPPTQTLGGSAPAQSAGSAPLSTATLGVPAWTAPVNNDAATASRDASGVKIYRETEGDLFNSMLEAKQAEATPFYMPRHGFVSRLENLLDKALFALGTVNLESNAMWFQTGANSHQGTILQLRGMHTGALGGGRGDLTMLIDVRERNGIPISEQLAIIDTAEGIVNGQRAQLGAIQNRLEFTRQSLDVSSENLSAAESRIRDTDMAKEMMRFTAAQVLQQAGISMLAQANQQPSAIMQLLR